MGRAKRAENHLNGVDTTSSGERMREGEPERLSHSHSRAPMRAMKFLRWTLARTSFIVKSLRKPAQQLVLRSRYLHASPDAALQFS